MIKELFQNEQEKLIQSITEINENSHQFPISVFRLANNDCEKVFKSHWTLFNGIQFRSLKEESPWEILKLNTKLPKYKFQSDRKQSVAERPRVKTSAAAGSHITNIFSLRFQTITHRLRCKEKKGAVFLWTVYHK